LVKPISGNNVLSGFDISIFLFIALYLAIMVLSLCRIL
jgi:hypothetical protein